MVVTKRIDTFASVFVTKDPFVTKKHHAWFPNTFDDTLMKPLPNLTEKDLGFIIYNLKGFING